MLDLEEHKKKYEQLSQELARPEVLSNIKEYKKLDKESKNIKKIIDLLQMAETCRNQIADNESIIKNEKDEEMIEAINNDMEVLKINLQKTEKKLNDVERGEIEEIDHIIMEIRAGAGGDEAALFAGVLFRMYSKYATKRNWKAGIIDANETSIGGYKEIIFEIVGDENTFNELKYESGVHRVQRIPETEKSGRIHTSTATVAIMPVRENEEVKINPADLDIEFFRSSGPGGQNVNKVETAVRIIHKPSGIVVASQTDRNQQKNKEKAMLILQSKLIQIQKEKEAKESRNLRQSQIGTADRSEKIRTYNFPQDRITDHRIKKSWHSIENILNGNLEPIINEMLKY